MVRPGEEELRRKVREMFGEGKSVVKEEEEKPSIDGRLGESVAAALSAKQGPCEPLKNCISKIREQ